MTPDAVRPRRPERRAARPCAGLALLYALAVAVPVSAGTAHAQGALSRPAPAQSGPVQAKPAGPPMDPATGAVDYETSLAAYRKGCADLRSQSAQGRLPTRATIGGTDFRVVDVAAALKDAAPGTPGLTGVFEAAGQASSATVLYFQPETQGGAFTYRGALYLKAPGTLLCGVGARLHAEDAREAAIMVQADRTGVVGFNFTGTEDAQNQWRKEFEASGGTSFPRKFSNVSDGKSYKTRASRIVLDRIADVIIADNTFDGAGRGALRLYGARNVAIVGNTVSRTQSDGIHIVHGSNGITVRQNTVRDTGDDCISVVSYQRDIYPPVENVVIDSNTCAGSRTRGITTIGGKRVMISNNQVTQALRAGILIFPAPRHRTSPVDGVLITRNTVSFSPMLNQRCPVCGGIVVKEGEGKSVFAVTILANVVKHISRGATAFKVDPGVQSEVTLADNSVVP